MKTWKWYGDDKKENKNISMNDDAHIKRTTQSTTKNNMHNISTATWYENTWRGGGDAYYNIYKEREIEREDRAVPWSVRVSNKQKEEKKTKEK